MFYSPCIDRTLLFFQKKTMEVFWDTFATQRTYHTWQSPSAWLCKQHEYCCVGRGGGERLHFYLAPAGPAQEMLKYLRSTKTTAKLCRRPGRKFQSENKASSILPPETKHILSVRHFTLHLPWKGMLSVSSRLGYYINTLSDSLKHNWMSSNWSPNWKRSNAHVPGRQNM